MLAVTTSYANPARGDGSLPSFGNITTLVGFCGKEFNAVFANVALQWREEVRITEAKE